MLIYRSTHFSYSTKMHGGFHKEAQRNLCVSRCFTVYLRGTLNKITGTLLY
jgi:hypothetical protein